MNSELENNKQSVLKKWLNKLQEDSWNLELLISGFTIFGLFKIWYGLEIYAYEIMAKFESSDFFLITPITILMIGVLIFIICLLIHIFFRGLWIGTVGLRYVSGDINLNNIKFSKQFKIYLTNKIGSYDDFILRLEKISSSIFSLTYLLFFIMFSIMLFLLEISILNEIKKSFSNTYIILEITYCFFVAFGIIVALDFITFGFLKRIRNRWFIFLYKPIYIFISAITLSFLWRPLLYNFIDNKYLKWTVLSSVPFLIGIYFFVRLSYNNYKFYPQSFFQENDLFESIYNKEHLRHSFSPEFYSDLRQIEKEKGEYSIIKIMSLPKYKINTSIMEVFVRYDKETEKSIMKLDSNLFEINPIGFYNNNYKKSSESEKEEEDSLHYANIKNEQIKYRKHLEKIQLALKEIYSFEINGIPISKDSMSLSFFVHPNFHEKGILCIFPLENNVPGINHLTLNRNFVSDTSNNFQKLDLTIPFIYNGSVFN
ncbi:hypothetical protein [Aquimarina agarilytica]|uniref:hypothetical protein n=1 Tax=Aquimarina agarilytica TaxID=1087449 RepID=UPI000288BFD0|nr:hypothetical protein [Aquimarina agarilytica]